MLWVMRVLGVLNFVFVGLGLYYAIGMFEIRWGKWPEPPTTLDWAAVIFVYAISLACLALEAYTGVKLIKGDTSVLRLLGIVFLFVVLYIVVSTIVDWTIVSPRLTTKAVGFWEGGEDPLDPQVFLGFPFVGGMTVLFLFWWKKRKKRESRSSN